MRQPLDLQDRGEGDRGPGRVQLDVHGQVQCARGQLVSHPPLAASLPRLAGDGRRRRPHGLSLGEQFLAGQLATLRELALSSHRTSTPTNATCPAQFAPTAVRWGHDNRTCALRVVGHGSGSAGREPGAGRRRQSVPGGCRMVAAGLHGIEHELPLETPFVGNAYADDTLRRSRTRCATRSRTVGEERARAGGVRRRRRRSLRQLRPGRAGRLRRRGDRLGAAPQLRAPVTGVRHMSACTCSIPRLRNRFYGDSGLFDPDR